MGLTKAQLEALNDSSFPNNNVGAITPEILRNYNDEVILNTVNQDVYTTDSASFDNRIDGLATTSSVNAVSTSVGLLQTFSGSQYKADSASFSSRILAVTGSSINTGSFATTGSNTFVGNQNVNAQLIVDTAGNQLILKSGENGTTVFDQQPSGSPYNGILRIFQTSGASGIEIYSNVNISGSLTASLQEGYVWVGDSTGKTVTVATSSFGGGGIINTGSLVTTASFNAYTSSNDTKVNNLTNATSSYAISSSVKVVTDSLQTQINGLATTSSVNTLSTSVDSRLDSLETAGYVTATITGSSLITASVSQSTITFTKGDGSQFNIVVADVSGSAGDFVTTASFNSYTGSQDFKNTTFATTGSNTFVGNQSITGSITTTEDITISGVKFGFGNPAGTSSIAIGFNALANNTGNNNIAIGVSAGQLNTTGGSNTIIGQNAAVFISSGSSNTIIGQAAGVEVRGGSGNTFIGQTSGYNTSGSNNTFIGAYQGIGNENGVIALSDGGQNLRAIYNSGWVFTGSVDIQNTLTASLAEGFTYVGNASGRTVAISTSSFATTSSNTFTGQQILSDVDRLNQITLDDHSGSLILYAKGFTSSSLNNISASAAGVGNIVFKVNNNTAETVVSGSNNIFTNPAAPTAGFKRYIGTSNIYTQAASVPQVSSSMTFSPTMTGNIISNNAGTITYRGAVSSSAVTMNHNILMGGAMSLGTSATDTFDKATAGASIISNAIFGGSLNVVASKTQLSSSFIASGNFLFGAGVFLNLNSSSISYNSNIQNGGITVNNDYLPISGTNAQALNSRASLNTIYGPSHGLNINGSNTSTLQTKQFYANIIAGMFLTSSIGSGDNCNILATGIIGNSLIVTGSSTVANVNAPYSANDTQGSLFIGRFNSVDGNKNLTAQNVFAVGTGTNSNRKTGFLIDSGSNTFVEGTLNVSGSTSFTGSVTIQSGSSFFANGNKQFNVGAFYSTITQSGSANVSQSMNFETTDISSGVSIVSNSRITLANSGTYNIQFSAQAIATGGADNLYIWLKKNGSNVAASAGNVEMANNAEVIAAWNYVVDASSNDYFELAWQAGNVDTVLLTSAASGNIPSIPSIILTVTQVR
jgi:hypothetical protein